MQNALVSVLIPSYNHQDYIEETINSIINQTYQNIELIIVDDGSKDKTFEKIKEMEELCKKRFKHFYFETKENEGTAQTFNRLITLAKGDYIYIIASDDKAKENAIEKEVNFLSNNPEYALCVCDNEFIDKNSKVCYWNKQQDLLYTDNAEFKTFGQYLQKSEKINFNSKDFGTYKSLYFENYVPNGYLIRKSIFEKTGLFTKEAPLEDWFLMLQIAKYSKMKFLDEVLFSYRVHPNNTVKNKDRMIEMYNKTSEYENETILKKLSEQNFDSTLKDVSDVYYNGVLVKTKTIVPFVKIYTYKKYKKKLKQIKFFNKTIFQYEK